MKKGENIYKRKDGRWEGRYIKKRDSTGKIIYGSIYGAKYSTVKEKLVQIKGRNPIIQTTLEKYEGSVVDWLNYWLNNIAIHAIKSTTFSNYSRYISKNIAISFDNMLLKNLTHKDIQLFVYDLQDNLLSPGTIRNVMNVLKKGLNEAVNLNLIKVNPCDRVSLPKLKSTRIHAMTVEDQTKLERVAMKEYGCSPIILALYSGMRIGEISGLKWRDIDFEENLISVNRTISRIYNKRTAPTKTVIVSGTPKTEHSARIIPLAPNLKKYLVEKNNITLSEYVVSSGAKLVEPRLINYRFKKALCEARIKDITFHSLRHTFATRCLENGVDIVSLSKLLGHQSVKMTLDTYADSMLSNRVNAMHLLDENFIHT